MADTKFLKAYCEKTGRYSGLEVEKIGGKWRVVNMIPLTAEEARLLSSEVDGDSFETHTTLLPCLKCGSRKVGGCACSPKRHTCSADMKYQFDCTYCRHLRIDHTLPTAPGGAGREGETITLSQGQEVKIRYADARPLKSIYVGVGWDPVSKGDNMDVDSSVVLLSPDGNSSELIFFGNKEHPTGCVLHHGDNLTGEGDVQDGDDENITVRLDSVPAEYDRLVFILSIYKCFERNQTLERVKNLYIRLYDPDSRKTLIEYRVEGRTGRDTGLLIGTARRVGQGEWTFRAIGQSLRVEGVRALERECKKYC